MKPRRDWLRSPIAALALLLASCAGLGRGCSSGCAQQFGADWIVVQFRADGSPLNCWAMKGASIANEPASDGVYWKEPDTGNLVHISGWYNRVQVLGGQWEMAAKSLGIDLGDCVGGRYSSTPQDDPPVNKETR